MNSATSKTKAEAWAEIAEEAQTNFELFTRFVLRTEVGDKVDLAGIHRSWINHVRYCWDRNVIPVIIGPWGHGKSIMVPINLGLYALGQNQNTRIKIVCNTDEEASKRLELIRDYIDNSHRYHAVFPHIRSDSKKPWTNHKLFIERGKDVKAIDPSVESKGVLTSGVSGRADLLLFDDIVDLDNAIAKPSLRKKVKEAYKNKWLSRLEPFGRVAYVGTLWHKNDLTHDLILNPETRGSYCILLQRISDDFGGITCEVHHAPDDQYPRPRGAEMLRDLPEGQKINRDRRSLFLPPRKGKVRY